MDRNGLLKFLTHFGPYWERAVTEGTWFRSKGRKWPNKERWKEHSKWDSDVWPSHFHHTFKFTPLKYCFPSCFSNVFIQKHIRLETHIINFLTKQRDSIYLIFSVINLIKRTWPRVPASCPITSTPATLRAEFQETLMPFTPCGDHNTRFWRD